MKKIMSLATAFMTGFAVMAIEMTSTRLLAPFFGTSIFVWANIIGLVLVFLTAGYFIGGRIADKWPKPNVMYLTLLSTAFYIAIIPFIARPVLHFSLDLFHSGSVGATLGSMQASIILFALPLLALGSISPFLIRLSIIDVKTSGSIAGRIYGISTIGSIVGTFLPVLIFIPLLGVKDTFLIIAISLAVICLVGLKSLKYQAILAVPIALFFVDISPIKAEGTNKLLHERESMYNYIRVEELPGDITSGPYRVMLLNEGFAIHSVWCEREMRRENFFAGLCLGPLLGKMDPANPTVGKVLIIGLGSGSCATILRQNYNVEIIDGVEIDSEIVAVGKEYMGLSEKLVDNIIVMDGRNYIHETKKTYNLVIIDAYQLPYIPFYLCTEEFFEELKTRMAPDAVLAINVGKIGNDYRLAKHISATLGAQFNNIFWLDIPCEAKSGFLNAGNVVVFATDVPDARVNYNRNQKLLSGAWFSRFALKQEPLLKPVDIKQIKEKAFTDDFAPVEEVTHRMIIDSILR